MKKFFQSKGFIAISLAVLCVTILGVCWFASRDRTEDFKPEKSSLSGTTSDWSDDGTRTDGESGAGAYTPGQSSSPEGECPKVASETEDEVMIDFTGTKKPGTTPSPVPKGKTKRENPGEDHPVSPGPGVPKVTIPPAGKEPASSEPAPGASNGNDAVYDPMFGWIVPGNGQGTIGDGGGNINKQVDNMG